VVAVWARECGIDCILAVGGWDVWGAPSAEYAIGCACT
jgi:hypothetical protein